MEIQIELINKNIQTKPTAKGSYQMMELAYKNLTFQGKVEGRKVMSFGNSAPAFKELSNANTGDIYEIEVVKNVQTGYNEWVAAKKSVGGTSPANVASQGRTPSQSTVAPRSTYETPEERAKKQIFIVRQSSLSNAIDLLSVGAKSAPKVEDVIGIATVFENFVFGTTDDDPSQGSMRIEDIQDSEIE